MLLFLFDLDITWSMNKKGVEEDSITLLHVKVNTLPVLHAPDAVIHFVHAALPIGVVVLQEVKLWKQLIWNKWPVP